MASLGILLACEHYPAVSKVAESVDAQLRLWLRACGTVFTEIAVYEAYRDALPDHAAHCDAWVLSGVPLDASGANGACDDPLVQFLRAATHFGRPIYAIHHGEHVLYHALAAHGPAPGTPRLPRKTCNPFRSFCSAHTLHRFNPGTRRVENLERPAEIRPRRMFDTLWSGRQGVLT